MSEEFDIFKKMEEDCRNNHTRLTEEYNELVKEIDNLVFEKYGEKIKQYKYNIKICRRVLRMKGKYNDKYFYLVNENEDEDKNNKCEDSIEK